MVVPAEVVDVLLSLKQHFRLLQQICGTCSCGSQTGCAGFRPRPKILSCVAISRAHQRSSWPTPTAFAHFCTHHHTSRPIGSLPQGIAERPKSPKLNKAPTVHVRATPPLSSIQHLHGFQVHWRGILTDVLKGIFKCFNRDSRESLNSHPQ